jgi:hypothetical protein
MVGSLDFVAQSQAFNEGFRDFIVPLLSTSIGDTLTKLS